MEAALIGAEYPLNDMGTLFLYYSGLRREPKKKKVQKGTAEELNRYIGFYRPRNRNRKPVRSLQVDTRLFTSTTSNRLEI